MTVCLFVTGVQHDCMMLYFMTWWYGLESRYEMDCADMIDVIKTMTFLHTLVTSYIWLIYYTCFDCHPQLLLIIFRIMMLYSAHPMFLLSASSLAIRETPHQRLCRWPPGWDVHCPFAGTGVDGTSQGESGDRTCEARRSPRRHDYTL